MFLSSSLLKNRQELFELFAQIAPVEERSIALKTLKYGVVTFSLGVGRWGGKYINW